MNQDYTTRAALQDADHEDLETLAAGAAMRDRLFPGPHAHAWVPRAGRDRLVGDVWQYPYGCGCGATAWRQNWCGKVTFVNIQTPQPGALIQNDAWNTPLPNGMLRWFGFDFDRAELPDDPLLYRGDPPQWTGHLPGFTFRAGVADASVTIEVEDFETDQDSEEDYITTVIPIQYRVTISAHGMDRPDSFTCPSWHEVQQRCRQAEYALDESRDERHALCEDEDGNPTEDTCSFCERGVA